MKRVLLLIAAFVVGAFCSLQAQDTVSASDLNRVALVFQGDSLTLTDTINTSSQVLADTRVDSRAKAYSFTLNQLTMVTIKMQATGSGFDTYLFLFNSNFGMEDYNDDYTSTSSRISKVLSAGTYYIVCTGYNSSDTGAYELTVKLNTDFATADFSSLTYVPLTLNTQLTDSLSAQCPMLTSPADREGCYAKGYSVQLEAGKVAQVGIMADDDSYGFDSYVYVLDANNQAVASNDDSDNEDYMSKAVFVVPATGTYHVVVTSYSMMTTGTYVVKAWQSEMDTLYVDAVNGDDANSGATASSAKKSLEAAMEASDGLGIYFLMSDITLGSDVADDDMPTGILGAIVKIYPYQRNVKISAVDALSGRQLIGAENIVIGDPNTQYTVTFDSLFFPGMRMFVGSDIELNNVVVTNSYAHVLAGGRTIALNNCIITNDTFENIMLESGIEAINSALTLNGTTINNIASSSLMVLIGSYDDEDITAETERNGTMRFENSTLSNCVVKESAIACMSAELYLNSGRIENITVNDSLFETNYERTLKRLLKRAKAGRAKAELDLNNILSGIAVLNASVNLGSTFSMDTNCAMTLLDTTSTIVINNDLASSRAMAIIPLSYNDGDMDLGYSEGRQVLSGDAAKIRSNFLHIKLLQYSEDTVWYIHNDGRIYTTAPTTGAVADAEQVKLNVYPNPASSVINAVITNENASEIVLLDVMGRVVKQQHITGQEVSINIANLACGVYFVQLRDGRNVLSVQKIVKK